MDIITLQLHITGKVQGVWYRASAKDAALSIGVKGKVWNEPNGDVGAIVQGTKNQIEKFIDWCKHGPPLARVVNVETSESDTEEVFTSFEIVKLR